MSDGDIPEVGGSATFDFDGHLRSAEVHVEVPGAADGSDPLRFEHDFTDHQDGAQPGPGWMPNLHPDPPLNIFDLPPHEGFRRDPITGVEVPDLPDGEHHSGPFELHMRHDAPLRDDGPDPRPDELGPGDFPDHHGDDYTV